MSSCDFSSMFMMLILVIGVREPDLWTGGLDGGKGGVALNGNATIVAAAGEAGVGVAQLHRTGGLRDNLPRFIVDVHGWEGMGYKAGVGLLFVGLVQLGRDRGEGLGRPVEI